VLGERLRVMSHASASWLSVIHPSRYLPGSTGLDYQPDSNAEARQHVDQRIRLSGIGRCLQYTNCCINDSDFSRGPARIVRCATNQE
jgi:hypothetical protein